MTLPCGHWTRLLRPRWLAGVAAVSCIAALAGWRIARWADDPAVPLLLPEEGAQWIVADEPFRLSLRKLGEYRTIFRKSFVVPDPPPEGSLTVRAFKVAGVFLDATLLAPPRSHLERWKEPLRLELPAGLAPGRHELQIHVVNENGPPALLAHASALDLRTGGGWEALGSGGAWFPARPAGARRLPAIAFQFPSTGEAIADSLPFLGTVFTVAAASTLLRSRMASAPAWLTSIPPAPSLVRWGLLLAWALLGANNLLKVPAYVGFDAPQHLDYVRYVAERGSIPLASEGWQMFQSPLFYLVSAPLYSVLTCIFEPETAGKLLRVVPIACGAAQVELSHRALCIAFPGRAWLQAAGTLVGGLLPMNLYLAQGFSNEPLAAALSGGVILMTLCQLVPAIRDRDRGPPVVKLGLLLGLALLAKASAALLIPLVLGALAWRLRGARRPIVAAAKAFGGALGTAAAVSAWYYLRNWIALGKPFFGGWDPGREIVWWQDPGYRTLEHFTRFGEALVHPVYAAVAGFWDALYSTLWTDGYLSMVISYDWRPPWNYGLMIPGALLALVPSAAIAAGALSLISRRGLEARPALAFSVACVGVYVLAMLGLFAALPIYSTGKATYLSGLTVCLALLAAAGLDLLPRWTYLRAAVHGALACWAAAAYLAYFVK